LDATPAQLEFVNRELARFLQAGAWEPSLRLGTLPSAKTGRKLVAVSLRPPPTQEVLLEKATQDGGAIGSQTPNPEGGLHVQLRTTRRVYALGINPTDRDYFIVNVRGQLYRLAGLPIG
jgi:hypothetical protein